MPRIFPAMVLVAGMLQGVAPSQICFAGHLSTMDMALGFGGARMVRAFEHGCCSCRSTISCAPPMGRMEGRSLSLARCSMSGKEPLAIRRDDPRLKIRDFPCPPLHMLPSCKDPGSVAQVVDPRTHPSAADTRLADLSGGNVFHQKPDGCDVEPILKFVALSRHELVALVSLFACTT